MVKVKVIKRYSDVVLNKIHEKDYEFETDEKRAEHLVKEGVAKILKDQPLEKAVKSGKAGKDE